MTATIATYVPPQDTFDAVSSGGALPSGEAASGPRRCGLARLLASPAAARARTVAARRAFTVNLRGAAVPGRQAFEEKVGAGFPGQLGGR